MDWKTRRETLIKYDKELIELQASGTCSFCGSEKSNLAVFRSNVSGKAICMRCYYVSLISMEVIPNGAIYCLKCKKYDSVICSYGTKVRAKFMFKGLDSQKHVIYSVIQVNGKWSTGEQPTEIHCGSCCFPIPFWIVEFNKYVKSTYS